MALVIALRNLSNLADKSDYEYCVYVNTTVIEKGTVVGHTRADGWPKLVAKLLEQRKKK